MKANRKAALKAGEIPKELKCISGPTTQVIAAIFAKALSDPLARPALTGLFSGLSMDFGTPVPEWVRQASTKFLESIGLDFLSQKPANEITLEDVGKIVQLWQTTPNRSAKPTKITKALDYFCRLMIRLSIDEQPVAARDFHNGRVKAQQIESRANNLSNRAKILILLIIRWPEVETLKSSAELWHWLLIQKESNGKNAIAPGTDSREVRAVCKTIGLRYQNRGGRPRKKN